MASLPILDTTGPCFAAAQHELGALGRRFNQILSDEGLPLWHWAREFLAAYEFGQRVAFKRLTLAETGARVGLAARGRPFSAAWVSRALHAARAWPQPPQTDAQRLEFVRAFHGHAPSADATQATWEVRVRRVLNRLRQAVVDALRLGCTPTETRQWLEAELLSAADVQKTAPAPAGGDTRVNA